MIAEFPIDRLPEATHAWNIAGSSMNAGQTQAASVDVRSDGGGFWTATLNEILLVSRPQALLWRALRQIANGGVGRLIVPRIDRLQPYVDGVMGPVLVPHNDDATFDDGSNYAQPSIDVQAAVAADLRATTLQLSLNNCAPLIGGELFSIEHPNFGWRLYEIATVSPADDAGVVTVTFNPPLREDVAAGTVIEFDRPRCMMKLVSPGAMDLDLSRLPCRATAKFVEVEYQ